MKLVRIPFIETEVVRVRRNPPRRRVPRYEVRLVREESIMVPDVKVNRPSEVFRSFRELFDEADREYFYILCLDVKNRPIGLNLVSMGSISASIVHPREVFKVAILLNAAGIIAMHNHISGDPAPSGEDLGLTRRLREAGTTIGIPLSDHVIFGDNRFFSMFETYPELRPSSYT